MSKAKRGFTLVEVALFLALTGLLFMGVVVGTGRSVAQQRFFDATQSFAEFLKSIYSQVSNPQSAGSGNSNLALYGKMISFGQRVDLAGNDLPDDEQWVFVYDVVGNADGSSGEATISLANVGASVVILRYNNLGQIISAEPAGLAEAYEPKWGSAIETTDIRSTEQKRAGNNNLFEGTILVVRHPRSGTINTLVSPEVIKVNELVREANTTKTNAAFNNANTALMKVLKYSESEDVTIKAREFRVKEVDFCVNPEGMFVEANSRWDIRIIENARNASGVETIDLDALNFDSQYSVLNRCRVANWRELEG